MKTHLSRTSSGGKVHNSKSGGSQFESCSKPSEKKSVWAIWQGTLPKGCPG